MNDGSWLEEAFKWAVGIISLLLGLVWTKQEAAVAALSRRLDDHETDDDRRFSADSEKHSREFTDVRAAIDRIARETHTEINASRKELKDDLAVIISLLRAER